MDDKAFNFLKTLLNVAGPSGFETPAARVWRAEAERFADDVQVDVAGNSAARLGSGGAHTGPPLPGPLRQAAEADDGAGMPSLCGAGGRP